MSKMKDFLIDLLEMYERGSTIAQIADHTGLPQDVIFDILQRCARIEPEGYAAL